MKKQERIELLAGKITILFGFCTELISDVDLLKEAFTETAKKADFTISAAPILGAYGMNYEEKNIEWKIKADRAEALINLIEVLDRTEKERAAMRIKKVRMEEITKLLGI